MRLRHLGVTLAGVVVVGAATLLPARAADPAATIGAFSAPFREDGFSRPGTAGCRPGPGGKEDCLPPGATMVNLPDGRVLYWSALDGTGDPKIQALLEGGDLVRDAQSRVVRLNAASPQSSAWQTPTPSGASFLSTPEPPLIPGSNNRNDPSTDASLFCSDQALLPDGRVIAFGGTDYYAEPRIAPGLGLIELEGIKLAREFNPATNTWKPLGQMHFGRWYPSKVTLPDGRMFIASGVTKLIKPVYPDRPFDSGGNVRQTETFDPGTGQFALNPSTADKTLPLYPRLHLLPNGKVFYGAAGQAFNPVGQSYDEALWNVASVYDPAGQRWNDLGIPGTNVLQVLKAGVNAPAVPGFRGSSFQQMLPLRPPYTSASFVTAGGTLGTTPGSYLPTSSTRIDRVDTSGGREALSSFTAGNLSRPRWYGTGVSLPTGQVLITSGGDVDHVISPGLEAPIRQVEMFTPNGDLTGGSWQKMATAKQGRTYHNSALLLPDGRVLIGGHDPIPTLYTKQFTLPAVPGIREFANNTKDASFEIFSPPYLFWGARPTIGAMPRELGLGRTVTVPTPDAAEIESVTLVRNTATTHLIDGDQRTVELAITNRSAGSLEVAVPGNRSVLPPGPYMLFVNKRSDKGLIPSVATQLQVSAPANLAPLRSAPEPPKLLSGLAGLANPLFSLPSAVLPRKR